MRTYTHQSVFARLRAFTHDHDDIPAFHAAFLVWAFLAAAVFNLGFFAILILLHALLDIIKYRDLQKLSWRDSIHGVVLEGLTDITLFFVALASSIYLHHSFALSILAGLSRAELTVLRASALIFSKMHILEHIMHVCSHLHSYLRAPHPDMQKHSYTRGQKICIGFLAASIVLLILAPYIYADSSNDLAILLTRELVPWKL